MNLVNLSYSKLSCLTVFSLIALSLVILSEAVEFKCTCELKPYNLSNIIWIENYINYDQYTVYHLLLHSNFGKSIISFTLYGISQ